LVLGVVMLGGFVGSFFLSEKSKDIKSSDILKTI
jgi:hypothetical protein